MDLASRSLNFSVQALHLNLTAAFQAGGRAELAFAFRDVSGELALAARGQDAMLALTQLSNYLTLKGSLSAVSKPNFASKYALELGYI